jgi:hypothetical protein
MSLVHLNCLALRRTGPVYLHEQCWVVGNTARGRATRVDDPELRLNRHAVVLDEAVLHRLVINIAGVQERRVEEELPCHRMLKAPPILEPALQTPRAQVGGEGEALPAPSPCLRRGVKMLGRRAR